MFLDPAGCSWLAGAAIDIYFTLARVYTSDNGSVVQ